MHILQIVDLQVRIVSEDQVIRNQRSRSQETTGKLNEFWLQYADEKITNSQLSQGCAGIIKNIFDV